MLLNTADRDGHLGAWGIWEMGHKDNGAHEHNFLNTVGIFSKILQYIDMDVLFLNIQ